VEENTRTGDGVIPPSPLAHAMVEYLHKLWSIQRGGMRRAAPVRRPGVNFLPHARAILKTPDRRKSAVGVDTMIGGVIHYVR